MDIGIKLSEQVSGDKNISEMIDKINKVASEYGFKVERYVDWNKFKKSSLDEYEFMRELLRGIKL